MSRPARKPAAAPAAAPSFGLMIKPMAVPGPAAPTVPRRAPSPVRKPAAPRAKPPTRQPVKPPPKAAPAPVAEVAVAAAAPAPAIPDPPAPPVAVPEPPAAPPRPPSPFSVVCRFNHYKSSFPCVNGVVRARDIDEQYCFSHVYKGAYRMHLNTYVAPARPSREVALELAAGRPYVPEDTDGLPVGEAVDPGDGGTLFLGCVRGGVYRVWIEEDKAEAALREQEAHFRRAAAAGDALVVAVPGGALPAEVRPGGGASAAPPAGSRAVALLTAELKAMSPEELREAGPRYRALLEARDLEDTLYGGT